MYKCIYKLFFIHYTTKTGRHDIAEILLKVALNTKNQNQSNLFWTQKLVLMRLVLNRLHCITNIGLSILWQSIPVDEITNFGLSILWQSVAVDEVYINERKRGEAMVANFKMTVLSQRSEDNCCHVELMTNTSKLKLCFHSGPLDYHCMVVWFTSTYESLWVQFFIRVRCTWYILYGINFCVLLVEGLWFFSGYSMHFYVIKFAHYLQQVGGFFWALLYIFMWWSLSITYGSSVVFSGNCIQYFMIKQNLFLEAAQSMVLSVYYCFLYL